MTPRRRKKPPDPIPLSLLFTRLFKQFPSDSNYTLLGHISQFIELGKILGLASNSTSSSDRVKGPRSPTVQRFRTPPRSVAVKRTFSVVGFRSRSTRAVSLSSPATIAMALGLQILGLLLDEVSVAPSIRFELSVSLGACQVCGFLLSIITFFFVFLWCLLPILWLSGCTGFDLFLLHFGFTHGPGSQFIPAIVVLDLVFQIQGPLIDEETFSPSIRCFLASLLLCGCTRFVVFLVYFGYFTALYPFGSRSQHCFLWSLHLILATVESHRFFGLASEDQWCLFTPLIFQGLYFDPIWARLCVVMFGILWNQGWCMYLDSVSRANFLSIFFVNSPWKLVVSWLHLLIIMWLLICLKVYFINFVAHLGLTMFYFPSGLVSVVRICPVILFDASSSCLVLCCEYAYGWWNISEGSSADTLDFDPTDLIADQISLLNPLLGARPTPFAFWTLYRTLGWCYVLILRVMLVYTSVYKGLRAGCLLLIPIPSRVCELLHFIAQLEWELLCLFTVEFCELCLADCSYGRATCFFWSTLTLPTLSGLSLVSLWVRDGKSDFSYEFPFKVLSMYAFELRPRLLQMFSFSSQVRLILYAVWLVRAFLAIISSCRQPCLTLFSLCLEDGCWFWGLRFIWPSSWLVIFSNVLCQRGLSDSMQFKFVDIHFMTVICGLATSVYAPLDGWLLSRFDWSWYDLGSGEGCVPGVVWLPSVAPYMVEQPWNQIPRYYFLWYPWSMMSTSIVVFCIYFSGVLMTSRHPSCSWVEALCGVQSAFTYVMDEDIQQGGVISGVELCFFQCKQLRSYSLGPLVATNCSGEVGWYQQVSTGISYAGQRRLDRCFDSSRAHADLVVTVLFLIGSTAVMYYFFNVMFSFSFQTELTVLFVVARVPCITSHTVTCIYGCCIPSVIICHSSSIRVVEPHYCVLGLCSMALDAHPWMLSPAHDGCCLISCCTLLHSYRALSVNLGIVVSPSAMFCSTDQRLL